MWVDRDLQSPQVLNSNLSDKEKEIIKLFVNSAVKEQHNPNNRGLYFDGIQTGIAQTLRLLGREDIWNLTNFEFMYHDELY